MNDPKLVLHDVEQSDNGATGDQKRGVPLSTDGKEGDRKGTFIIFIFSKHLNETIR